MYIHVLQLSIHVSIHSSIYLLFIHTGRGTNRTIQLQTFHHESNRWRSYKITGLSMGPGPVVTVVSSGETRI